MENENNKAVDLGELDSFLTFEFNGKEYKGVCIPLDSVTNEYNEKGLLIRSVETISENNPIITEFSYDEEDHCISAETYESGLVKPKKKTVSISEYDDQGRLTKTISPVAEREFTYDDKNHKHIIETRDKINNTITHAEVLVEDGKEPFLLREITSMIGAGPIIHDEFVDYDSKDARKFEGYERVVYHRNENDELTEFRRLTYDRLDRLVRIVNTDAGEKRTIERVFMKDHPDTLEKEIYYLNDKVVNTCYYDNMIETGEFIMTSFGQRIIRRVDDDYTCDEYIVKAEGETDEWEMKQKIFYLDKDKYETVTFLYDKGKLNAFEYVDDSKKDNKFAYGLNKEGNFSLLDADVRVGDTRYVYVFDHTQTIKTKIVVQRFEDENSDRFISAESIAVRCSELLNDINDKIVGFIKSNEALKNLLTEKGGINIDGGIVAKVEE